MYSVLFVCLGNICRSPTAEAVFRSQVAERQLDRFIHIDSAGTGDWHIGKAPDSRAQEAAKKRGYDLSSLSARQVRRSDFETFDLILAMDNNNLADLQRLKPSDSSIQLELFLNYARANVQEVPDPYYGGLSGFDVVLDLVEAASSGLLNDLQARGLLNDS
jgi:protein-tyrosine phosphatase